VNRLAEVGSCVIAVAAYALALPFVLLVAGCIPASNVLKRPSRCRGNSQNAKVSAQPPGK